MSSFPILDLVVGMIFIHFLLSIICSSAVELWLSIRRTRAKLLEQWLMRIFNAPARDHSGQPMPDKTVGQAIMDHCMITALSGEKKSPAYINAPDFVSALFDQITRVPVTDGETISPPPKNLESFLESVQKTGVVSNEIKRTIILYANEAQQAVKMLEALKPELVSKVTTPVKSAFDMLREKMERWYDANGERLTATFKRRKVLPPTVILAIAITLGLNADSVSLARYLYDHKEAAKEFADKASTTIGGYEERIKAMKALPDTFSRKDTITMEKLSGDLALVRRDFDSLKAAVPQSLPMGWSENKVTLSSLPLRLAGWVATILAICLGAPFWFDILNKIANLRSTGAKPPSTADEKK